MEDMTTDDLFQDDVVEIAVDNNVPTDNDADVAVDTEEEVQPVDDVDDTDVAPTDTEEEKDIDAVELSGVERYLSDYGIVAGRITFEDGENVDFDALDPEEQYTILQSLTTESRPTIEDEYDLDTTEIDLLNDIRNSGVSVEEYMNSTINQHVQQTMAVRDSNAVDFANMPDDAIFLRWLQETNPDIKEEAALEVMESQKENQAIYESQVANLRSQYAQAQENFNTQQTAEADKRTAEVIEQDRYDIVSAVENIDSIGGAEINDQMKNEVLHSLLEINDQGDPLIMEEMFSDPERLFKAAWFMKYGESYLDNVDKYWKRRESESYKRGRADLLNGAPDSSSGMARNHVIPKPGNDASQVTKGGRPNSIDALWED